MKAACARHNVREATIYNPDILHGIWLDYPEK
jgi:hypothetical protein